MTLYARVPLVVEAITVEWGNLDDLQELLKSPKGEGMIAYVNTGEDDTKSITLHEGDGPMDTSKEIGVLLPQEGGNFLLVNQGDWVCRHSDETLFPLKPEDFTHEFEIIA